ncbi:hypothetical protein Q7P35_005961 [Cladosporium inversicolor]
MSQAKPGHDGSPNGIDLSSNPTAQKLATRYLEFLKKFKICAFSPSPPLLPPSSLTKIPPSTPGAALEQRLNRDYSPSNPHYLDFCTLIKQGLEEG